MNRFRNKGLWVALASFLLLLLQTMGVHVVADQYTELVNSFLGILVMAGILSNPTSGDWFTDQK
jgi:uncharacterized membrane protein